MIFVISNKKVHINTFDRNPQRRCVGYRPSTRIFMDFKTERSKVFKTRRSEGVDSNCLDNAGIIYMATCKESLWG